MSILADAPESKIPEEAARSADDRTSFSVLILRRVDRVEDEVRDLCQEMHQEIGQVRQEVDQLSQVMHQEIGQIRQKLGENLGHERQEVTGLHAEIRTLTQRGTGIFVALAVGAGSSIVDLLLHHP